MNVKQRILSIRLSDKIKKNPSLAKELGLVVKIKNEKRNNLNK